MALEDMARAKAREAGPVAPGGFRVVTFEPGGRVAVVDVASRAEAERYVQDCKWEAGPEPVLAFVFDERLGHA